MIEPVSESTIAGVDGCRGGWVVATLDRSGRLRVEVVASFAEIIDRGYAVIGVDMPIGLAVDGVRTSDSEVRRVLGPRRSSLFPTPAESVLTIDDYTTANRVSREVSGKGLSKQAFSLLPKIREVRTVADQRCFEVHPETSFAVMAGAPMAHPKRTPAGHAERSAHLARSSLAPLVAALPGASPDDVLDALAALWTARRIATDSARVFGDPNARDAQGFRLTIHA